MSGHASAASENTNQAGQDTRHESVPSTRSSAMDAASYRRVPGANDRIGVGFIGFGLIGKQHVDDLKQFADIDLLGMCEADRLRLEEGLAYLDNPAARAYGDFRQMLDDSNIHGVVISTPDHWHALQTIMACQAGKDVYVEKPMTLFIDEGKWMVQAARQFDRTVVVGTQRRHYKGVLDARRVIQRGMLGKIHSVRWSAIRNVYPGFGITPPSPPPEGMDYDMWLGPAENKPYTAHRGLYHFRWFWDFSGGQMTNLGAHIIDQVMYVMQVQGPTMVSSVGGRYALEDDGETPDVQDTTWVFPGADPATPGFTMNAAIREANAGASIPDAEKRGQLYLGTRGTMVLSGNWEVFPEIKRDPLNAIPCFSGQPVGGPVYTREEPVPWIEPSKGTGVKADASYGVGGENTLALNKQDWLNCMRTRQRPLCDVEDGHRVATACHLANLSLRLGRTIDWDPEQEKVIGDPEAAAMCVRQYRAPWDQALKDVLG